MHEHVCAGGAEMVGRECSSSYFMGETTSHRTGPNEEN